MGRWGFVPPVKRRPDGSEFPPLPPDVEAAATKAVDAAFKVHSVLGPGLTENVYEACLCRELAVRGIPFRSQVSVPISYEGVKLDASLRSDLIVDERLIMEIKSVERLTPLFEAQLMTYLRLTNLRLGLLVNFNTVLFKEGIKRIIC